MFGLINLDGSGDLLLKSVDVNCSVNNLVAACNGTLVYRNDTGKDVEGLFLFPRENDSEMISVRAEIGGRVIVGQWKDADEVKALCPKTTNDGEKDVVVQYDKVSMPIVKFRIRSIPAKCEVKITLSFVLELKLSPDTNDVEEKFTLGLPSILTPIYTTSGDLSYGQTYTVSKEYNYTFAATLAGTKEIKGVNSDNHILNVTLEGSRHTSAKIILQSPYDCKKDLDVNIYYARSTSLSCRLTFGTTSKNVIGEEIHGDFIKPDIATLSFIPTFQSQKLELVFLVDRSDSMYGPEIEYAKECVQMFVKGIPSDSMFQIYGYGSYFDKAFIKPQLYDEKSLKVAMDYHKKIAADCDGTDFIPPLTNMFSYPISQGYSRIVFLLTDGDVSNKEEVIRLIKDNSSNTTLNVIGLGPVVSRTFIQQIAEAGHGKSYFVTESSKLCSTFKALFESSLEMTDFIVEKIEWQCPKTVSVSTVPNCPIVILPNQYLKIFCIIKGLKEGEMARGKLIVKMNGNSREFLANILYKTGATDDKYTAHHLMAKYQIQDLIREVDNGNLTLKDSVVKISKESNIESRYSFLIALDLINPLKGLRVLENMDPLQYYRPLFNMHCYSKKDDLNSQKIEESSSSYLPVEIWISDNYKMSTHGDIVIYIADKQNVNGSWDFDLEMAWRLGFESSTIEREKPDVINMEIWITTIVFEFLSTKLKTREKEWQLLGKKAKEFISINIKESTIIDQIQKSNSCDGAKDVNSFIKYLTNKALFVLNEVATTSSYISDKEINIASSELVAGRQKFEIVFVVDRSASMNGLKIESAKQCLFIFLKSLPENCKFQIYGFGTNFDKAFKEYKLYDDDSIQSGLAYQSKIEASFGGTDLHKPLQDLYSQPLTPGYLRLLFVLTDGQVSNQNQVIALAQQYNSLNKLYAIGIGRDVSVSLVNGMAQAGLGKASFVEESSILSSIVIDLLDEALCRYM